MTLTFNAAKYNSTTYDQWQEAAQTWDRWGDYLKAIGAVVRCTWQWAHSIRMIGATALVVCMSCCTAQNQFTQISSEDHAANGDPNEKLQAWDSPLKGAVYAGFYGEGVERDLDAAQAYGFNVVRLVFPGMSDADSEGTLIPGAMTQKDMDDWDSEYFDGPRFEKALETLDKTVDAAHKRGMYVIISPGPVPGSHGKGPLRWRLYRKGWRHWELADFWQTIAKRYHDNPAVIGYLLLNEPGFEVTQGIDFDDPKALVAYYKEIQDTPADLNLIYSRVVGAIREVDLSTPIIVQPGQFGRPQALQYLRPIDDERVIYCVHWYGPWLYTTWRHNRGRWSYPGQAPSHTASDPDAPGPLVQWDINTLSERFVNPILSWQKEHSIPSSRIYVGEFSADRRVEGADAWMHDMLSLLRTNGWHWTYYMFRERRWNAMDHELGPEPTNATRSLTPIMRMISGAAKPGDD